MPIVLKGFDELLATLGELDSRVTQKKILAASMRKALVPLFDRFEELAPDDPNTPGNRIRLYERKAVLDQSATSVLGKVGDTPKGFVGLFQEFGTSGPFGNPAQHFAETAWNETEDEVTTILGEEIMIRLIDIWNAAEEEFDAQ